MKRFLAVMLCTFALFSAADVPAFAYDEQPFSTGKNCNDCHGLESGQTSPTIIPTKGPHGGYTTGTQKCQTCHTIHNAAFGSVTLLPAATIKDTCFSCHDGTGGKGVYGTLLQRGLTPASAHRVEVTNVIPGGAADGSSRSQTFSAAGGFLTCSDCHSPHDSETVAAFTGDRARESAPVAFNGPSATKTNRLLRSRPTGSSVAVTVYGSSWCGTCHVGRLSGSAGVVNHAVETETAGFVYDNIVRVTGPNVSTTAMGTLGGTNNGFVMPLPRTALQNGHAPICQQCHEDSRSIGQDVLQQQRISTLNGFNEVFNITAADGVIATNNPRFQVFPHESSNARLLVETEDDLCTNCHVPPGG